MADLVATLRERGETVPSAVIRDLRSAKTMIEILKVDQSRSENLLRLEEYLTNVESFLMSAAKRTLEKEYVDELTAKIAKTQKATQTWGAETRKGFPLGVPRGKSWFRIKPSNEVPLEKIRQISREMGLTQRSEEDGCVLVYGEEDKVKGFVKKAAGLAHKSGDREHDTMKNA